MLTANTAIIIKQVVVADKINRPSEKLSDGLLPLKSSSSRRMFLRTGHGAAFEGLFAVIERGGEFGGVALIIFAGLAADIQVHGHAGSIGRKFHTFIDAAINY